MKIDRDSSLTGWADGRSRRDDTPEEVQRAGAGARRALGLRGDTEALSVLSLEECWATDLHGRNVHELIVDGGGCGV